MLPEFKVLGITLYYWGYILAFAADFIFNLVWYRKKFGFNRLKAFLATALVIPLGYGLILIMSVVHKGGVNWVRAVLFIPLAVYLICLILKTNYAKTFDFLTPTACINHGVSHIFQRELFPVMPAQKADHFLYGVMSFAGRRHRLLFR